MLRFILRRLLQAIVVMWAVATIVFLLVNVIGTPASLMLPIDATPTEVQELSEELGFEDPIHEQYFRYLGGLLSGDFGTSLWLTDDVTAVILDFLAPTLALAGVTMALTMLIGPALGTLAAARQGSFVDKIVVALSFISVSLPEFWLGLLLIAYIAVDLGVLPTSGFGGPQYYVLPVLTLLARPVGRLAQTTKISLLEELSKPHIVTALAKGLSRRRVLIRHGLRNSLLSVVTLAGDEVAQLVAGAVVVETVFGWPGVGLLSIRALENRDPELVVGIALMVSAFVVSINFIVDVMYGLLDPRVRHG